MRTKKDMLDEASQIEANLETGKYRGKKAIKYAKWKMYNLRWRAAKRTEKAKVKKAPKVDAAQGILPNFLPQMDVVRIEELVAERIFNEMIKRISKEEKKKFAEFAAGTRKRA